MHAQHVQSNERCDIFARQGSQTEQWVARLSSVVRPFLLCGSACGLLVTHDVHHGRTWMCVNSRFILSVSVGSHGAGIILAPASEGILQ